MVHVSVNIFRYLPVRPIKPANYILITSQQKISQQQNSKRTERSSKELFFVSWEKIAEVQTWIRSYKHLKHGSTKVSGYQWSMEEMEIPVRKVMPWQEDASHKFMGLNPGAGLHNLCWSVLVSSSSSFGISTLYKCEWWTVLIVSH